MTFNPSSSCFDGQYIPQRAGAYALSITYGAWRFNESAEVAGGPFISYISPGVTFGPYSDVVGLTGLGNYGESGWNGGESEDIGVFYSVAGDCYNFTIIARDGSRNLRLRSGDDFEVQR